MPGRLVGVTVDARRRARVSPRAADARAAHPPREGDVEHLHGAGAARGDRRHVRGLSRPGGPDAHRAPRAPADRDPAAGLERAGLRRSRRALLRHAHRRHRRREPRAILARGVAHGINFRRVDARHARHRRSTRRRRAPTSSASGDVVRRRRRAVHGRRSRRRRSPMRCPRRSRARRRSSRIPVFNRYHSETEMLRYLRRLADRDLALDRSMIPLGSCTMKLNATVGDDSGHLARVRRRSIRSRRRTRPRAIASWSRELEQMLCAATGYAAVSLQPNAGSQGEYAGLLVIRAYHASRGEAHRNVCLIPASAHGTNPASAQMAGMQVVVVACDGDGNVDLADLEAKANAHARRPRRDHDHLSVDARRVRGRHPRASARSCTRTAARSTSTAPT